MILVLSLPLSTLAASEGEPVGSPLNPEILHEEVLTKAGPNEPTAFYNLVVRDYEATGTFRSRLIAGKYFSCNSNGRIYVGAVVERPEDMKQETNRLRFS